MTNEEAKVFLDNLKICINEHPIVADWLVEIANRKDEPQRDCFLCKWLGEVNVCGRCRNRNLFAKADTEPKPKDEPTISKMEQVDKDINVRSKDEPQTERSE